MALIGLSDNEFMCFKFVIGGIGLSDNEKFLCCECVMRVS